MGLIQLLENETFYIVSHREFLQRIKKMEVNLKREAYVDTAGKVIRVEAKILQMILVKSHS